MDIDRRLFLLSAACLLTTERFARPASTIQPPVHAAVVKGRWHTLVRSLIDRADRASSGRDVPIDATRIERIIHDTAHAHGRPNTPVIKWLANPFEAFGHLSRCGLDALLQMESASLWPKPIQPMSWDEDPLESSLMLRGLVAEIMRIDDYDRALTAPKLLAKSNAMKPNASPEALFEVRALSAQIGWLETCLPVAAAQAVADIELLLSSGFSQDDEQICHQLKIFEAYELGLLATWESPTAIICVPEKTML